VLFKGPGGQAGEVADIAVAAGVEIDGLAHLSLSGPGEVSWITVDECFQLCLKGVMISASHNPFYDNGIKLMNGVGEKMDDALQAELEAFIDGNPAYLPWATEGKIGKTIDFYSGRNHYFNIYAVRNWWNSN
jgi:phosphoglucosamine mutase